MNRENNQNRAFELLQTSNLIQIRGILSFELTLNQLSETPRPRLSDELKNQIKDAFQEREEGKRLKEITEKIPEADMSNTEVEDKLKALTAVLNHHYKIKTPSKAVAANKSQDQPRRNNRSNRGTVGIRP